MNKTKLKDRLGKEHKRKRLRSILLLNLLIAVVAIISIYMAFYRLDPGTTQIQVIFVVQLFAGISNAAIWVVSVYMYGLGLDTKEYFQRNANILDDALGEVMDLTKTLNSENAQAMKKFISEVDWEDVKRTYDDWKTVKNIDYDEQLDKLIK